MLAYQAKKKKVHLFFSDSNRLSYVLNLVNMIMLSFDGVLKAILFNSHSAHINK